MTNTRKEIIRLIEPYMEKELKLWCLIQKWEKYSTVYSKYDAHLDRSPTTPYNEVSIWNITHSKWNWYSLKVFDKQEVSEYEYKILSDTDTFKILWHYDITAVLKYIEDTVSKYEHYYTIANWFIWFSFTNQEWKTIKIPNKPLHLYNNTEEEDLLALLKKL